MYAHISFILKRVHWNYLKDVHCCCYPPLPQLFKNLRLKQKTRRQNPASKNQPESSLLMFLIMIS